MSQERLTKPYTQSLSDLAPDPSAIRSAYALANPTQSYINFTAPHVGAKIQIITPEYDIIPLTIDSPLTPRPKRNREDQQIGTQFNANHHTWGAAAAYATLAQQEHQRELIRNIISNPDNITKFAVLPTEIEQRIRENQNIRRSTDSLGEQIIHIIPDYMTRLSQSNAGTFSIINTRTTKDGRNLPFDFVNDAESAIHIKTLIQMYTINDKEWEPYSMKSNHAKTFFALGNLAIAHLAQNTIENRTGNKQLNAKEWKEVLTAAEHILDWGYRNLIPYIQTQLAANANWTKPPDRQTIITARPREINRIIEQWLNEKATPVDKAKAHWFLSLTGMTMLSDVDPNRIVSIQALRNSVQNARELLRLRTRYNDARSLARLAQLAFAGIIGDAGHSDIYNSVFRTYNAYYESRRRQTPSPLDIGAQPASMNRARVEQIIDDFNTQGVDRLREISRREGLFGLTGKTNYLYIFDGNNPQNQVAPILYERYTQELGRGLLVLEMDDLIKQARSANASSLAAAAQKHLSLIAQSIEDESSVLSSLGTFGFTSVHSKHHFKPELLQANRNAVQKSLTESLERIKSAAQDGILTPIELGELNEHVKRLHTYASVIEKKEPNNPFVRFVNQFKKTFDRVENINDAIGTITPTTIANTRFQAYWYGLDPKALRTIGSLAVAPYGTYKLFIDPDNNIFTRARAERSATRTLGLLIPTDPHATSEYQQFQRATLSQLMHVASELGDAADLTITMWTVDPVSLLLYRQFYGGELATVSPYFLHGLYGDDFLQKYISSWMTSAENVGLSRETGAFVAYMLLSIMDPATIGSLALDAVATRGLATLGRAATATPRLAKIIGGAGSLRSKLTHLSPITHTRQGIAHLTLKYPQQAALIQMTTNAVRGSLRWARRTMHVLGDLGDVADAALMNGDPTTILAAIAFSPEYFLSRQYARRLITPFEVPIQTIVAVSKYLQSNRNLVRSEAATFIDNLAEYSAQALETPYALIDAGKQALVYDTQNGWVNGTIVEHDEQTITVRTIAGDIYQNVPLSHALIAIPTELRDNPTFAKNSTNSVALGIIQGVHEKSEHDIPVTLSVIENIAGKQATKNAIEVLAAQGFITIEPNTGAIRLTNKGNTLATALKNPTVDALIPVLQSASIELFDKPDQQQNFIQHVLHTISQMDDASRQAIIRKTVVGLFDQFYKKAATHAIGMKTLMHGKLSVQTTQGFKRTHAETKTREEDKTEITLVHTTNEPLPSNKPYIVVSNITLDTQTNPEILSIIQELLESAANTKLELAGTKTNNDGTISLAFQPVDESIKLTNKPIQESLQKRLDKFTRSFLQPLQNEIQELGISDPESLAVYAAFETTINPILKHLTLKADQTARTLTPEEQHALDIIQQTPLPISPIQTIAEAAQDAKEERFLSDIRTKQRQITALEETIQSLQMRIQELEKERVYAEREEKIKEGDRRIAQWMKKQKPSWYKRAKEARKQLPLLATLQEELAAYQEMQEKDETNLKYILMGFMDKEPIDHILAQFFGQHNLEHYLVSSLPLGHETQYRWMAQTLGQITGAEAFRQIVLGAPIGILRETYKQAYQQALTQALIRLMPEPDIQKISDQITREINRWKIPPNLLIKRIISDAAQGKHNEAILSDTQALKDALLQAGVIAENLPDDTDLLGLVRIYYNAIQDEIGVDAANLFLAQIATAIALAHAHANAIIRLTTLTEAETHNLWIATNTALTTAVLSIERQLTQSPIGAKTTSPSTKTVVHYKDALKEVDDISAEKVWQIPSIQQSITQSVLQDIAPDAQRERIKQKEIQSAIEDAMRVKKNLFKQATHDWLEFHNQTLTRGYDAAYGKFKRTTTYKRLIQHFTVHYGKDAEQELDRYLHATYRLNIGDISTLTTDRIVIRNNTSALRESPELLYALKLPNLYFAITTAHPVGEQSIAPRISLIGSSLWNYTTLAEETLHALAIAIQNRVVQNIYSELTQTIQADDDPRAKLLQTPDMATLVGYYALTYNTQRKLNERSPTILHMPTNPQEAEETIIDMLQLKQLSEVHNMDNPAIHAATRAMIGAEAIRWKLVETIKERPDERNTIVDDLENFGLSFAAPRILATTAGIALALKLESEQLLRQLAAEKLDLFPSAAKWLRADLPPLPAEIQHLARPLSTFPARFIPEQSPAAIARFSSAPQPERKPVERGKRQDAQDLNSITTQIRTADEPKQLLQILTSTDDDYLLASILNYITYIKNNENDPEPVKTSTARAIYLLTRQHASNAAPALVDIPITPLISKRLETEVIEFAIPIIDTNNKPTGMFAYYKAYKSGRRTHIGSPQEIHKTELKEIIRQRITPQAYQNLIGRGIIYTSNGVTRIGIVTSVETSDDPTKPRLRVKSLQPIKPEISQELKSLFDYRVSKARETDITAPERINTVHDDIARKNDSIHKTTKEGIYLYSPHENQAVLVIDPIRLALKTDDAETLIHHNAPDRAIALNELLKVAGYQTRALRKQNDKSLYTLPSDNDLKSQVTHMYNEYSKEEALEILRAIQSHLDMLIAFQPQNPALELRRDLIIDLTPAQQIQLVQRYRTIRERVAKAIIAVETLPADTTIIITDTIRVASRDVYAPLKDRYITATEYEILSRNTSELIQLLDNYEQRNSSEGTPQSHFHMGAKFRLTSISESTSWRIIQLLKELISTSGVPTSTEPMEILIKDMDIRYQRYPLIGLPVAELRAKMRSNPEKRDTYRETVRKSATHLLTDLRRKIGDQTTQLEDNIFEAILHAILSSRPHVLHQHIEITKNIRTITADPTEQSIEAVVISVKTKPIAIAIQYSTSSRSGADRTLAQPHLIPIPQNIDALREAAQNALEQVYQTVDYDAVQIITNQVIKPLIGFYGLDPYGLEIPKLSTAHGTSIHLPTIFVHSLLRNLILPLPIDQRAITQHTIAIGIPVSQETAKRFAITLIDTLATELNISNIAADASQQLQQITQRLRLLTAAETNEDVLRNIERELTEALIRIERSQDVIRDQARRKAFYDAISTSIYTLTEHLPLDAHTIAVVGQLQAQEIDATTAAIDRELANQATPPETPAEPYRTPAQQAALQQHILRTQLHSHAQTICQQINQTTNLPSGNISYNPEGSPDIQAALSPTTTINQARLRSLTRIATALQIITNAAELQQKLAQTLINNATPPSNIEIGESTNNAIQLLHTLVETSLRFDIPAMRQSLGVETSPTEQIIQHTQEATKITEETIKILETIAQNQQHDALTTSVIGAIIEDSKELARKFTSRSEEAIKEMIEKRNSAIPQEREKGVQTTAGIINVGYLLLINTQIMLALAAINKLTLADLITPDIADISRASSAIGYGDPQGIIIDYSINELYERSATPMHLVARTPNVTQAQQIPVPPSEMDPGVPPKYVHAVLPIGSPIDRTIIPETEANEPPPLVYHPSTTNPYALGVGLAENLTHTVGMLAPQLWRLASADPEERRIRYEIDEIAIEGNIEDIILFLFTGVPYKLQSVANQTQFLRSSYQLIPPDIHNQTAYYQQLEEALILLYELLSQVNDNPIHVPHGILGKLPTDTSLDKNNPAELGYLGASVDIIRQTIYEPPTKNVESDQETSSLQTLTLRTPIVKKLATSETDPLQESYFVEPLSTSIHKLGDQHQKIRTAIAAALYIVYAQAADTLSTHMLTMQRGMKDAIPTYIADLAFQHGNKTRIAAIYDYLEATTPHMKYALYSPAIEASDTIRKNARDAIEKQLNVENQAMSEKIERALDRTIYSTGRIARLNTLRNQSPTDEDAIIIDPRSKSANHYTGFRSKRTATQSAVIMAQTRGENITLHPEREGQENEAIGAITSRTRGFLAIKENRWEAMDGMPAPLMEGETRLALAIAHTLQIINLFGENNQHITGIKGEIARTALIRHGFLLQSTQQPAEPPQTGDSAAQLAVPQTLTINAINTHIITNFNGETGISAIPPKASGVKAAREGIPELPTLATGDKPIARNTVREKILFAARAVAYGLADLPRIFQDIENTITARRRGEEIPKLPNIFDLFEAKNGLGAQYTWKQTHPGGRRAGNVLFASWMTTAFGIPGITLLAQLSRFKIAQDPGFAVTLMATGGIVFLVAFATYYAIFSHMKTNPFASAFETLRSIYKNTLGLTIDLMLKDKRKAALQRIEHKWNRLINRFLAAGMTVCYTAHLAAKVHARAIRELRKRRQSSSYIGIIHQISKRKGETHNIDSYKETVSELEEIYRLMGFEPTSATWIIGDILGTATTFGYRQQLPETIARADATNASLEARLNDITRQQIERLKEKIRKYELKSKLPMPIRTEDKDPAIDLLTEIHNTIALLAELTYFTTKETVVVDRFIKDDGTPQISYNLSSRRNDYAIAIIYLNLLMDYLTNKRVTYTNTQLMMDLTNIAKEIVRDVESRMPGTKTPLYEALVKTISIKNKIDDYSENLDAVDESQLNAAYAAMEYMYTRTELIDSLGYKNYADFDKLLPTEPNLRSRNTWYDLTFTRDHEERTSLARNLRSLPVGLVVLRNRKRYKEVDYIEGYSRAFALHSATYDNNPYSINIARAVLVQTLLLGKEASRLADKIGAHIQRGYSMDTLASILAQQAAIAPPRIPKPKETLLGTILHSFMMGVSGITALANAALMTPFQLADLMRGKELVTHRARVNAFHIASELASKSVLAAALGGNLFLIHSLMHTLLGSDQGSILSYLFNHAAHATLLGAAYAAISIKAARQTIPVMSNIFQFARNYIAKQITSKDVVPAIGKAIIAEAILNHDLDTLQEFTEIQPSEKTATEIEKQATHTIEANALAAINATVDTVANQPAIVAQFGDDANAPIDDHINIATDIKNATRTHRSLQANLSRITARVELPKEIARDPTIQSLLLSDEQKTAMQNALRNAVIAALRKYYKLKGDETKVYISLEQIDDTRYQGETIEVLDLDDVDVQIIETSTEAEDKKEIQIIETSTEAEDKKEIQIIETSTEAGDKKEIQRITIEVSIPNIDEQQIAHQIAEIALFHYFTSPDSEQETRPTFKVGLNKHDYENGAIKQASAIRIARDAIRIRQQMINAQAQNPQIIAGLERTIQHISRYIEHKLAEIAARTATDAATLAILTYQYNTPNTPKDHMPLKEAHIAINKEIKEKNAQNLAHILVAQLLPTVGRELAISMENSINKQTHVIRTTTPAIGLDISISTADKRHLTPEAAILLDAIAASQATTTTQTIEAIQQHSGQEYTKNTRDYGTTLNATKRRIQEAVLRMKAQQPEIDDQKDDDEEKRIKTIESRLSPYAQLIEQITNPAKRRQSQTTDKTKDIEKAVEEALLTAIGIGQDADLNELIAVIDKYRLGNLSLGDVISAMTREGASQAFIRRLIAILTIMQPERNTPSGYIFDANGTLIEIAPSRHQTDTESANEITEALQKVVLTLIESPQQASTTTPLVSRTDYLNYMENINNVYEAINKIIYEIERQIMRIYPDPESQNNVTEKAEFLMRKLKTITALRTLKDALGYIADATYRSYRIYQTHQKRTNGNTLSHEELLDHFINAMILRADTEHALHRLGAYNQILREASQDDTELIVIQAVQESLKNVPPSDEPHIDTIRNNIFESLYIGMLQHFAQRARNLEYKDTQIRTVHDMETNTETTTGGIKPQSQLPVVIPIFGGEANRTKDALFNAATRNALHIVNYPILTIGNLHIEPMQQNPTIAEETAKIINLNKAYQTTRTNILGAMEDALIASEKLPHSALAIFAFDAIRAYAGHQPSTLDTIVGVHSNTPVTSLMTAILEGSVSPEDKTRTNEMNLFIKDTSHTQRTLSILLRLVTIVLQHRARLLSGTVNKLFTAASMAPNYAQALLVNLFGAGYVAVDSLLRSLRKLAGYYGPRDISQALLEATLRTSNQKALRSITGYIPRRGRWLLNTLTIASLLALGLLGQTLTRPNTTIPITDKHMLYYDLNPNSPFAGSLYYYSTETGRSYKISISPIVDMFARVITPIYQVGRETEYGGVTTDTAQALLYATGDTMIRVGESSMGSPTLPIRIAEDLLKHSFGTRYRSPFGNVDTHFFYPTVTNDPILRQAFSILGDFTSTPQAILPEQIFRGIELNNPAIRNYSDLARIEISPDEAIESLSIASLASVGFPTFAQNTPYGQPFGLNNPALELGHPKAVQPTHQDSQWTIRALAGTRDSTSALLPIPQGYYNPKTGETEFQSPPRNVDLAVKLGSLRQHPITISPYNLATAKQRQQAEQRQQNPARTFTEALLEASYRTHAQTNDAVVPTDPELPYIIIQNQFGKLDTLEEQQSAQIAYNILETALYANLTGAPEIPTSAHTVRMLGAALLGTTSIADPLYHHEVQHTLTTAMQPASAEQTPEKREHLINLLLNIPSPYETLQVAAKPTLRDADLPANIVREIASAITNKNTYKRYTAYKIDIDNKSFIMIPFEAQTTRSQTGAVGALTTPEPTTRTYKGILLIDPETQNAALYAQPNNNDTNKIIYASFNIQTKDEILLSQQAFNQTTRPIDTIFATVANQLVISAMREAIPTTLALIANLPSNAAVNQTQTLRNHINTHRKGTALPTMVEILDATRKDITFKFTLIDNIPDPENNYVTQDIKNYISALIKHYQKNKLDRNRLEHQITNAKLEREIERLQTLLNDAQAIRHITNIANFVRQKAKGEMMSQFGITDFAPVEKTMWNAAIWSALQGYTVARQHWTVAFTTKDGRIRTQAVYSPPGSLPVTIINATSPAANNSEMKNIETLMKRAMTTMSSNYAPYLETTQNP